MLIARVAVVLAALGIVGGASTPAAAQTSNFGQQVKMCANMMLPPAGPDGQITMTMNGTTMTFRNFGAMVTYMQDHSMCS